jgi:SpoVK/Ycf46/Vps4 family AAA+-type ATPase
VKKNGLLEVVDTKLTLADIGGLSSLKKWLLERAEAFTDEAVKYKLPKPKGVMNVGQPGTGKSMVAKAIKSVLGVPLLRLDGAKLFGSLVGQSEANWRSVHATAKAMAPVILWVDEVDGMFSGGASSGQTDGGTTSRVIKSILQDMQENSDGIFYVFTANDIDNLPSPVLRRLDEVWNVELPNLEEREQIWAIQIANHHRDPKKFNLMELSKRTEGYSGAEIEKLVRLALYTAFHDKRREPNQKDLMAHIDDFMPLSKTMADDIEKRRKRLAGVAKSASGNTEHVETTGKRKLATFGG